MRRAFTLVELLVVLAIIAILAAILFPAFAQAKAAAKKIADLSNMNQLGLATQMYMADHDDTLFFYASYTPGATVSVSRNGGLLPNKAATYPLKWWNALMPYLHDTGILVAPDDGSPTPSVDPTGATTIKRSYIACRHAEALNGSQIEDQVDTIVVTEKWSRFSDSWIETFNGDFNIDPATGDMALAANRYAHGLVGSYLDGHAKLLPARVIDASVDLTGCRLVHLYPVYPTMCDTSLPGCTNTSSNNICNSFIPYP